MARSSQLKLRDLDIAARHDLLAEEGGLDRAVLDAFRPEGGLTIDQADHMIENTVGVLAIPVGVACNFTINGRDVLIPMATEEPSVVAAASNAARIARIHGGFHTSSTEPIMQAQVQVVDAPDPHAARLRLLEARAELLELANAQDPMLVSLGGGARDLVARLVRTPTDIYVVAHVLVDVRDAMGANAVNSMAEAVSERVAEITGGRVLLRILTRELPMPVGLVGGATNVHPTAQVAVQLLGISTARELAEVIVAVGLAQNVAACRALATEGIQRGHMSLHARNVAVATGATPDELPRVVDRMVRDGAVRTDDAERILTELRSLRPKAGDAG
jgi:hydroxymethylglutaryl-CoA reductase